MANWAQLQKSLFGEFKYVVLPITKKHKTELGQTLVNSIFDDPGPKRLSRRSTEKELFYRHLCEGFGEIHSSIESMKNAEVYLSRFPFPSTRISRPSYLRYHVENYFNELYILKQRLLAYLTKIGREFRRDARHADVLAATRPLFRLVDDSLKEVVNTRGRHVHQERYTDDSLDRLELMNIFVTNPKGIEEMAEALDPYYKSEYRKIRSEWRKRIKNNNSVLSALLDAYAEKLMPVLFSADSGRLNFPSNLRET